MKKLTKFLGVCVLTFLSVTIAQAQDVSVDDIIKNYYENIGGVDNWKNLKNMKMSGSTSVQGGQMIFPTTIFSMKPNFMKREIDIQGKKIIVAYDGETAWMINPMMGSMEPQKMSGDEAEEMKKEKFEDDLIDYAAKGHAVELEENEEVDGTDTYKVKLTLKEGDVRFYFFDTENFVPIMMRQFVTTGPMKGEAANIYFSEYNEVNGLMIPHSIEQKVGETTVFSFTAEKVEFDVDEINETIFEFPEEEKKEKE